MGGNTLKKIETIADPRWLDGLETPIRRGGYTLPQLSPEALASYRERVMRDGSDAAKSRLEAVLQNPTVKKLLKLV